MGKLKGRAKQFAALEERPRKDYDPEAEPTSEHSQSDPESSDEDLGTEHYVSVGKSRLRQKEPISLGPKYSGSRVSRATLEDESESDDGDEEDDSEDDSQDDSEEEEEDGQEYAELDDIDLDMANIVDDEEIESDNALAESDEERFKDFAFRGSSKPKPIQKGKANRPKAVDWMQSSDDDSHSLKSSLSSNGSGIDSEEEVDDQDAPDEDEDMDSPEELDPRNESESDEDDSDGSEDEEDEEDSSENEDESASEDMQTGAGGAFSRGLKSTVSRLSASAEKEAAQGVAFREQRKAFDSILNLRVRLQKSLVATNSLAAVDTGDGNEEAYDAAEEAAIKLWNTLDSLRAQIHPDAYSKLNTKRKRGVGTSTSSDEIWENMAVVEKRAAALRKINLEKWSEKANRGFIASSRESAKHAFKQTLTSSLDGQLANPERLVKKTQTPRSCAPMQAKAKKTEDPNIYDDADFYQLLLKELLDQRTAGSSSGNKGVTTVVYTAQREAKPKKVVDTKASKGRKMKYNVHEKLMNSMTSQDKRTWEKSAIDRLFGSLLGKKHGLEEDDDPDSDEEGERGIAEESALRLFRS